MHRKMQAAYDNGPVSDSSHGERISILRRPSLRWGNLVNFIRVMKENHPLQHQQLPFERADSPSHYQTLLRYIQGRRIISRPHGRGKHTMTRLRPTCKTMAVIPEAGHNSIPQQPGKFAAALRTVRETL